MDPKREIRPLGRTIEIGGRRFALDVGVLHPDPDTNLESERP